jgi:hypothetical protein
MGAIQPCCFEERKTNRKNGIMRLTKGNKRLSNPINNNGLFKKFQSNKGKSSNKKNEEKKIIILIYSIGVSLKIQNLN